MESVYGNLGVLAGMIILAWYGGRGYGQLERKLNAMERKLNALLQHAGLDPTEGFKLSDRVKNLARDPRRKIEAIKVYREETGTSLVEAKEAVETFINSL
jgi:ribosomal protein L7/L12